MPLHPILDFSGDMHMHSGSLADPGNVRGIEGFVGIPDGTDFTHRPHVHKVLADAGIRGVRIAFERDALHFQPPVPATVAYLIGEAILAKGVA